MDIELQRYWDRVDSGTRNAADPWLPSPRKAVATHHLLCRCGRLSALCQCFPASAPQLDAGARTASGSDSSTVLCGPLERPFRPSLPGSLPLSTSHRGLYSTANLVAGAAEWENCNLERESRGYAVFSCCRCALFVNI